MYTNEEILGLGFTPYTIGDSVDGVILQADHSEYMEFSSKDFPGLRALVDGRRILKPENFEGISFRVIGAPEA
jgi:UDP-N-acetyl-D-mannosaminuronate dehydrogenase